jgi:hypothetical protein
MVMDRHEELVVARRGRWRAGMMGKKDGGEKEKSTQGRTRTHDPLLRRQVLYPTELHVPRPKRSFRPADDES